MTNLYLYSSPPPLRMRAWKGRLNTLRAVWSGLWGGVRYSFPL